MVPPWYRHEGRYKNPRVKTFAWWYAAVAQDERRCPSVDAGFVEEESSDDGEGESVGPQKRRRRDSWSRAADDLLGSLW